MTLMNAENESAFRATINEGISLVDYAAPWCPPCKPLLPILEELGEAYVDSIRVIKVNCDDLPGAASEAGVMSLPTVILYKDGVPMEKLIGLRPKSAYQAIIDKHL
ncbi:thioredoxin family protein [Paenibacillus harenae]|uniref:thioredoxin family protein n=1 Tax=Paenibacillus harenae TaxID=306543 RepID=UPI002794184B|nr:thioredoxin domain-containing protein [Paenibacillus harenae]MDQ0063709.1 thioredoxin 1 [Paenibacillus harenae]